MNLQQLERLMINYSFRKNKFKTKFNPAIILVVGLTFFCSCENDVEKVSAVTASREIMPVEVSENIEMIYTDFGKLKTTLKAPILERYLGDEPKLEFREGLELVFYDSLQNPESSLIADYAIHNEKENIIIAKRNVEVINEKGEKLNTEKLIWEREKQQIHTDEFVRITTADEVILGEGLISNESFTKYTIKKIKGTINLKDEEETNE